jgi:hypothetical protein
MGLSQEEFAKVKNQSGHFLDTAFVSIRGELKAYLESRRLESRNNFSTNNPRLSVFGTAPRTDEEKKSGGKEKAKGKSKSELTEDDYIMPVVSGGKTENKKLNGKTFVETADNTPEYDYSNRPLVSPQEGQTEDEFTFDGVNENVKEDLRRVLNFSRQELRGAKVKIEKGQSYVPALTSRILFDRYLASEINPRSKDRKTQNSP